jgi:hypothetical protein
VHGVLNSDNMSVLGLTIDYGEALGAPSDPGRKPEGTARRYQRTDLLFETAAGPYGFMDGFDPDFTPNLTDAGGRR